MSAECGKCGLDIVYPAGTWPIGKCPVCDVEPEPMSDDECRKLVAQAKIGLEAVIDEVTGYQADRAPDALRKRYAELGGDEDDYALTPNEARGES